MGARLLKLWLEQPLLDIAAISERLDAVEELAADAIIRSDLRKLLDRVYDLERLAGRIAYGSANARDLIALKCSLEVMPQVYDLLRDSYSPGLVQIQETLDCMDDVVSLITDSIHEEPPLSVRDGNIIKTGFSPDVDKLRTASREGKQWIASLKPRKRNAQG